MKKLMSVFLALTLLCSAVLTSCGTAEGESVNVQSVAMLCGMTGLGTAERFLGVVSARSEAKIEKDEDKAITEILVKEGDAVTAGQVLFSYDMDYAQLQLEKAKLELEQLNADTAAKEAEKEQLEKEKKTVTGTALLNYTVEIQTCETTIRENNYNAALKEKEIARLEESLQNLDVTAPVTGVVQSLNETTDYDNYGNVKPFITIVETGAYMVKGYINENNAGALPEGTEVLVYSRVDDRVWNGTVSRIDWENPTSGSSSYYSYSGDDTQTSSKYPFYVELENFDGILLGQHVYIEPAGAGTTASGLMLAACYLTEIDGDSAAVWAENSRGRLEKRTVALGTYDEFTESYEILSGLTAEDYIAWPDDTLTAGMTCVEFDESAFEVSEEDYVYDGDYAYEDGYAYGGEYDGIYEEDYAEGAFYEDSGEAFTAEEESAPEVDGNAA